MTLAEDPVVIAIDGPAGAGKSTIAKKIAKELGFSYLDTGAMYRALTLKAMRIQCAMESEDALAELAVKTSIDLQSADDGIKVFLDGQDVSQEIRTVEVTNNTFYIARAPKVRAIMVSLQQKIATQKSIVVEGRDVTTVVFPQAQYKFYLDANVDERANRRYKELREKGNPVDLDQLKKDIRERDECDFTRAVGALKIAEDAVVIDSTALTIEQVAQEILKHIRK